MPFFGGGGGGTGGGPYTVITTTSTLESQKSYMVDTSSSAYTVTLPATPANGDYVEIFDRANSFGTNNLTIDRNGNKIESLTENLTGNVNGAAFKLAYADSTTGWQVIPFYGFAGPNFVGATTSTAGVAGVVPAPAAGDEDKQLLGDGAFAYGLHLPRLKSVNSRFVAPFNMETTSSTSVYSNKIRNFVLFYFPVDGTINRISIFTSAAVTQNAHYAMWKYNPTDATVGDLIYDIGTVSLNSLNNIHKDFSVNQSVKRGLMWISFTTDGTSAATRRMTAFSGSWMAGASAGDFLGAFLAWHCDLGAGGTYNQTTNTSLVFGGNPIPPYMYIRYA